MDAALWAQLDIDAKYAARVCAVALTRRSKPVLSHWSAAVLHGLPVLDSWPNAVHTTQSGDVSRYSSQFVRHNRTLDPAEIVEVDGMLVTSVARTVLDIATVASRATAVAMADRAILVDRFGKRQPLTTKKELREVWEHGLPFRGHVRSLDVIEFAETRAESPLESLSRVTMRELGFPTPELQVDHYDDDGFIGATDFTWPEFGIVGESDGLGKYLKPELRGQRSAGQVVVEEKLREDRLRAKHLAFRRWGWSVAQEPARLRAVLVSVGLPTGIRHPRRR